MKNIFLARLSSTLVFVFISQLLFAQAIRTWVSGVGDDVNPCSRTAPCKTFAGAISKTAAAGEINAIDPGGYGAVTIAKSMTIDGNGTMASILSSGTNGMIINAPGGTVILRNLSINGTGITPGINGIRFIAARLVIIENCYFANFSQKGVEINTTDSCSVQMTNVTIHNAQDAVSVSGNTASLLVDRSNLSSCGAGITAQANTVVVLSNNIVCNNGTAFQGAGKFSSMGNNTVAGNKAQGVVPGLVKMQ